MKRWNINWAGSAILVVAGIVLSQWSPLLAIALILVAVYAAMDRKSAGWQRPLLHKRRKEVYWRGRRIDLDRDDR